MSVYESLKGLVYDGAMMASGRSNAEARTEGFSDVFELIMRDSDHPRQQMFLLTLPKTLSEKQRQVLLDGLAREYAGVEDWMAYVDREAP